MSATDISNYEFSFAMVLHVKDCKTSIRGRVSNTVTAQSLNAFLRQTEYRLESFRLMMYVFSEEDITGDDL